MALIDRVFQDRSGGNEAIIPRAAELKNKSERDEVAYILNGREGRRLMLGA